SLAVIPAPRAGPRRPPAASRRPALRPAFHRADRPGRVGAMNLHLETRAIHAAAPELNGSRPGSVPIYQPSTFAFAAPDACSAALADPDAGFAYSRYRNPTTRALEDAVADLEGGAAAIATSSGMGAINAVLLALLRPGDHVIAQRCLYGGTFSVFTGLASRYGIDVSY